MVGEIIISDFAKRKSQPPSTEPLPEIRVNMLGDFQLHIGDTKINDDLSRSQKMWNLLAYLIVHRDRNVPQEELIEMLWPEDDSLNPANALKTLLYRTRAMLMPMLGGELQLILSQRGSYSWNRDLPCHVDAEIFEQLVEQASEQRRSAAKRMDLYAQAMALYKRDFLPKLSDQLWVIPLTTYYHALYLQAVQDYAELLMATEQYSTLVDLCSSAIQIEAYDEKLHALLIRVLLRQGNGVAALNHYEAATDLLYRNLGVRPSEELRALYQEIMKEQKNLETDLGVIQEDLRETMVRPGAFVCEYGFFREAYRLESRRATRQGSCVHVALITISLPDGKTPPLALLNTTMDQLLHVLRLNLRRGDVVARYSGAQYVIMLPTANYEDSNMVMDRIITAFNQQYRKNFLRIGYKIQQMDLNDYNPLPTIS